MYYTYMLTIDVIYIHDKISPVIPTPRTLELDFGDLEAFRPRYRCLYWLLTEKGYNVKQTLPGVDRQQSVDGVLNRASEWLGA